MKSIYERSSRPPGIKRMFQFNISKPISDLFNLKYISLKEICAECLFHKDRKYEWKKNVFSELISFDRKYISERIIYFPTRLYRRKGLCMKNTVDGKMVIVENFISEVIDYGILFKSKFIYSLKDKRKEPEEEWESIL